MTEKKLPVLVVDDELIMRQLLTRILERQGFNVTEAIDGQEAITKLKASQFVFVISDIKMPNMDGFELLKEIRQNYSHLMVLLITGYKDKILRKAEEAGADGLITKPFKNIEIIQSLSILTAKRLKIIRARQTAS